MTVQMSARLWRWPLFLAAVLVSMLCVWLFKDQSMHIPVADGPRYTRQFVVAWMPVFGSILLIDPTPDITATLPRARLVYLCLRCLMLIGTLTPLMVVWSDSTDINHNLYDAFAAGALLTLAIITASRWHAAGLLTSSLVSVIWLLIGDTLATALRFSDITGQQLTPGPFNWLLAASTLGTAGLFVLRGSGSTNWR
ncbi:hypothetical protein [Tessaracoccus sp. Z1128]